MAKHVGCQITDSAMEGLAVLDPQIPPVFVQICILYIDSAMADMRGMSQVCRLRSLK